MGSKSGSARPVTFEGCAGWLHPADGDVGVLLCSPWGFEDLCMRRAWRMLADACAGVGYPTLRFDYPGCGDSLGSADDLTAFTAAAAQAARALRDTTGVSRLVLVGQGFGAAVATLAAREIGAEALALLAPLVRGRDHLRELSLWGRMVAETMHIAPVAAGGVAGFVLPPGLAETLATLDLGAMSAPPAPLALVVARPGRPAETKLAACLRELGAEVVEVPYEGYEAALGNPTSARPPAGVLLEVVRWLQGNVPLGEAPAARPLTTAAPLAGDGFVETTVRFGPAGGLAGVLCEPQGPRRGATVLMLSAGGDPHIGWARAGVDHARALAREGVASLRMDAADVGDSAGPLCAAPPRLYDDRHIDDAIAAVDWLEARGLGPVLPVGRCSGAFIAFNAAVRDDRIADVLLVNQQRFVWDRDGQVELAADKVRHYHKQTRDPAALLRRAFKGELDLLAIAAKLGRAAVSMVLGKLAGHGRRQRREIRAAFTTLKQRGVPTTLLYSAGTEGHREFAALFEADGRKLMRFADVDLRFLEDADHGLTSPAARAALYDLLRERALDPPSAGAVAAEKPAARREQLTHGSIGGAVAAH